MIWEKFGVISWSPDSRNMSRQSESGRYDLGFFGFHLNFSTTVNDGQRLQTRGIRWSVAEVLAEFWIFQEFVECS